MFQFAPNVFSNARIKGDFMGLWILEWNNSDEPIQKGREEFSDKVELKERLDELKGEYPDELEWEYYQAEKCKCCGSLIRKEKK